MAVRWPIYARYRPKPKGLAFAGPFYIYGATMTRPQAFTIPRFTHEYGISRSLLYKLWSEDRGPRRITVGTRVLIPSDAADAWFQSLKDGSSNDTGASSGSGAQDGKGVAT